MTIKKIIVAIAFILCFSSIQLKAQTVYITDSGKKYHAKNCSSAKTGKKGITLAEAKKQGYEACKLCKVEATEDKSKVKKETKDKSKS